MTEPPSTSSRSNAASRPVRIPIADRVNGQPITESNGPVRMIFSDEVKYARWLRNLTALTVRSSGKD